MSLQFGYAGASRSMGTPPPPQAFKLLDDVSEKHLQSHLPQKPLSGAPGVEDLFRGLALARSGDWQGAVEAFRRVVKIAPSSETYSFLAHAHFKLGEYLRAAKYFEKATKLKNNDHEAFYSLGLTYYQLGNPDRATKAIRRVTKLDPQNATAFFLLGYLQRSRGNWDEAAEAYREAIRLKSNFWEAYQYLAILYLERARANEGDHDAYLRKSIATFKELIEVYPKAADAYSNIGYLYEELGESEKASEAYRKAVEVVGDDILSLTDLGTSLLNAKRYSEAKEVFARTLGKMGNRISQSDVSRAMLLTNYGVACLGLYNSREAQADDAALLQEAEESFLKALSLNPRYVHAQLNLGATRYEQGRMEEAIEAFKKTLEIDPENEHARNNLQTLMEQQLDERLQELGLLKEIREPITDLTPYRNRTLMTVRDKTLSETVIEGRR